MPHCYDYEYMLLDNGSLDTIVDCTYVLTMTNSARQEQIKQQLKHACLTSKIVFQYNHGYKRCAKPLKHNQPNYDLCHANQTAFKHALSQGYERILLLEDDCEFDNRIKDQKILSDIKHFLHDNDPSIYNLGPVICFRSPIDILLGRDHRRMLMSFTTHAVIYNRNYMEWSIHNSCLFGHTDATHNTHWSKFTYKLPLAYQKATFTENARDGWGYLFPILNSLIYKPFNLDKQTQPGYDQVHFLSDALSVSVLLLLIYFVVAKTQSMRLALR